MKKNRRTVLKAAAAAVAGAGTAGAQGNHVKKVIHMGPKPDRTPLYSPAVTFGPFVFLSGVGAHFKGDIKAHTKHVLDEIEKRLAAAGSSMEKVLKVSVFLNDLADYDAMNEVYRGRFGEDAPVRTTVAPARGIPGHSLVEIDVIAHL